MSNKQFAATVVTLILCMAFTGCPKSTKRSAKPYIKPSAADGGPEDEAIQEIEALGGTCLRFLELKGLLVERDRYWMEDVKGNPVVSVCSDDCQVPNELLMSVAKLEHIQSLCIRRSPLNDEDAAIISQLETLRSLRLENTNITAKGVSDLAKLKLEQLNFDSNPTNDASLKIIASISTLKELHLNVSSATDIGFAQLVALKELKYLLVGNCKLSDTGLKAWSNLEALEELTIVDANISGVGFQSFDDSGIRILDLRYCKISPAGLREIARLPVVEELSLFSCSLTDAGLESLAEMVELISLNIYGNSVTEAGLRKLGLSQSLRSVDVTECKITNAECQQFNQESAQCRAIIVED